MHTAYLQLQLAADAPPCKIALWKKKMQSVYIDIIRNQDYAVNKKGVNNCNQLSIVVSQTDLILKIDMGNSYG